MTESSAFNLQGEDEEEEEDEDEDEDAALGEGAEASLGEESEPEGVLQEGRVQAAEEEEPLGKNAGLLPPRSHRVFLPRQ